MFAALTIGCVLVLVAGAYCTAWGAELLRDSLTVVTKDPRIQAWQGRRIAEIFLDDYWYGRNSNLYRPLTTLTYALNYSVLGNADRAIGYVAVNVLLHVAASTLVAAVARAIGATRPAAFLAALVFAAHPLATEAVTNVVGRADLLVAVAVLAGLLAHARIVKANRFAPGPATALAIASATAIGSKETGITLIALLVLYDLLFVLPKRTGSTAAFTLLRRQSLRSYLWCLAPLPVYFVLLYGWQIASHTVHH
jgi:hypothetical protein